MTSTPGIREVETPAPSRNGHATRAGAHGSNGHHDEPRATASPVGNGTATETPAPAATAGPETNWVVALLVLIAGMFMSVLDISIVNVAILTMQNDFGVTTEEIQWVPDVVRARPGRGGAGQCLAADCGSGRAGSTTSRVAGFAARSALCGLAWNLESDDRVPGPAGDPGRLILPVVTLTILYKIVPREKIGAAMGMYGLGIVVAPAIGPTLGGYLVEYVDWRLIFFINVPVGILGMVAAMIGCRLPSGPGRPVRRARLPDHRHRPVLACCWAPPRARTGAGRPTRC